MIDMTYDPEADAACIYLGKGKIAETAEAGPFIVGIELLDAKSQLPGDALTEAAA